MNRTYSLAAFALAISMTTALGVALYSPQSLGAQPHDQAQPAPVQRNLHDMQVHAEPVPWTSRAMSLAGVAGLIAIAWTMSTDRKRVPWRVILGGTAMQLLFAVLVLKTSAGLAVFSFLNDVMDRLLSFTADGSRFLFGNYLDREFSVALNVLPTIIFFSSLMTLLYHMNLMQPLVRGMAWVMQRTLKTSGAETLSTAANIFVGQTEAPLVVKPFVATMTRSELMAVMVGGFASVAGGVLAAYVGMLKSTFPDIAGHLIAASVMSAPATLVIAKVMVPETEVPVTANTMEMNVERPDANMIDAAARGAGEGLMLALNVGAMLLAFLALVALVNYVVQLPSLWHNQSTWHAVHANLMRAHAALPVGCDAPQGAAAFEACIDHAVRSAHLSASQFNAWPALSLERILAWVFWPIAFLMGVSPQDCSTVATLLGEKTVLNEFVAYLHLGRMLDAGVHLSHRSLVIATYALCGFANFGSIAIQIGGIGGMAPSRRGDIARLGLRAMIGGSLASFWTAAVAGLFV